MLSVQSHVSAYSKSTALLLAVAALGMVALFPQDALAQAKNFGEVQKNIGRDFSLIPNFLAVLCYVAGAFFAATGLIRLRAHLLDSDRNTLQAALFRLIVASLMIWLPFGLYMVNTTLFGTNSNNGNSANLSGGNMKTPAPQLTVF